MAGKREAGGEPARCTAYYYADLEKMKRASPPSPGPERAPDTYSTAGTFPMPEPKEKEPLLAELEAVGRVPLRQLAAPAAPERRARSWYLCCPELADDAPVRDSSWRYASLRPVTAPPLPSQHAHPAPPVCTESSAREEEVGRVSAERDALARALAGERARAAAAARAHDARLAELHGVIAELMRRRAHDHRAAAIPEEDLSESCESTTQPAGELQDDERSATEHRSASPPDLDRRAPAPRCEAASPALSCQRQRASSASSSASPATPHPPHPPHLLPPSPGRCESRHAKVASRVRLKKTELAPEREPSSEAECSPLSPLAGEQWCVQAAERLALQVCAQADEPAGGDAALWRARAGRLAAEWHAAEAALRRALDTQHRLWCACAAHESSSVVLCAALRAADRALELYDVLLALAETAAAPHSGERAAAEAVAWRVLRRVESAPGWGQPLLSPGPWHEAARGEEPAAPREPWSEQCEARLRRHAARLKRETVELRALRPPPHMYSPHDALDADDADGAEAAGELSLLDMETAVVMQEVMAERERRVLQRAAHKGGAGAGGGAAARRHRGERSAETDL